MTFVNLLGYVAAIGTTSAFIPQAIKVYKTKKTDDLSLGTFIMFCFGVLCWAVYGVLVNAMPIILANGLTFIMAFYILIEIIKQKQIKLEKRRTIK